MDHNTVIQKVSEILVISESDSIKMITDCFLQEEPFNSLVDLLGYSNIELIFEIFKFKDFFKPDSSYKNDQAIYIEHIIPEPEKFKITDKLVKTSIIGENAKYFSYAKFNPVQSKVYDNIYNSDENILVSAPTGAGKTDIALLSIIRALKHRNSQIIYIVPMKALANEIFNKYQKVFKNEFNVIEYTGDTEIDHKTAARARIIICTPEKFDASTRKLCCVFENIKLIIIDEIHLLEDDRGPVLEALVARSFILSEIKQSKIRIVGLSATLPNYKDVAEFIKAKHIHFFDSSYRPVPLKMTITGFIKSSNIQDERDYLATKISEYLNKKKQVLVFVNSRAKTFKTASFLIETLPKMKTLIKGEINLSGDLLYLVNNAIGIHHAGLCRKDRLLMEKLFKDGKLNILVCTSTLAWGVNLPAYAVIINGAKYYNNANGKFEDISILDVLQIFGRAGRPQYDTKGEAILMTSSDKIDKYIKLLQRSNDIESKLLYSFPECLNSEIYLNNISSIATALAWVKNTFLYTRMMKNPSKYGILFEEVGKEEQALSEYVYLTINFLEECGLIKITKQESNYNTWRMESSFYGQVASIFYLNHLTMYTWLHDIHLVIDELSIIKLLLKSKEFESITVRSDEITYLNNLHQELLLDSAIEFDFDETVESKLLIILISFLRFKKMPIFSLSCDCDYLIDNLKRLVSAMKEILSMLKRYELYHVLLLLDKRINRCRKEKFSSNCRINGTVINDNFVEIQVEQSAGPCTMIISSKKEIINVVSVFNNSKVIIPCKFNEISIDLHSNENWQFLNKKISLETDYSLHALCSYGTHCCEKEFNLFGKRSNCIHFQEIELSKKFSNFKIKPKDKSEESNKDVQFTFNKQNIDKESRLETFNNLIDISFDLNFTFRKIDTVYYKERLKIASMAIEKLILEDALIVCPSYNDAKETCTYLNTKAALDQSQEIGKYGMGSKPSSKFWICTFEEAENFRGFNNIIFKSASDLNGLFKIFDIFKIADNRNAIIYETGNNIEYLSSIYKKN